MSREQAHHWQFGYTFFDRETETHEKFMSERRRQVVLDAIKAQEEPESLALGKELRASRVQLGSKCVAGKPMQPGRESEMRERYAPRPYAAPSENFNHLGVELRKAHIDHAFGQPKTASHWQGVLQEEMSRMAHEKYTSGKPQGLGYLGEELRKSSLVLNEMPSTYKDTMKMQCSEQKDKFVPKPYSAQPSYASTLGKDLRASHFDTAQGPKNCRDWVPQTRATMEDNSDAKWNCGQPEGFQELGVELRKSSVPLAGSGMTFMMQKATGPQRPPPPRRAKSMAHLMH
eukprot:TRINITY_DN26667_c0_g1_i1.p1 TRINITY_DN26667_c0_g1~~TRINITY_DN26667_c0_g1_i1.p1  ORF type:complete len:287 (-),score=56.54 TRINITY_DN26667_c0_g1_i1:60-920(-)